MKLEIDTTAKTIKVIGSVNVKELHEMMKKLFPDKQWEEYSLEQQQVSTWTYYPYTPYITYNPPYTITSGATYYAIANP